MTLPVLRIVVGACTLAVATLAHAATPLTLPLGDLGVHTTSDVELPLPPAPQVARPDVSRIRVVIKRQPQGCDGEERRAVSERRQAVGQPRQADPWSTKPAWSRLG